MNTNFTPAFPTWIADDSMSPGMTLRDYFAAVALQGILARENPHNIAICAIHTYKWADAMMEARK